MRHFVLTRSAYGPDWTIEANRRRLEITRGITARLMAAQTWREWTWVVLFDERDPLLAERMAVFRDAAPAFVPVLWTPQNPAAAPWDKNGSQNNIRQKIAATAYRAAWPTGDRSTVTVQTRLDDDDGLSPGTLAAVARAVRPRRMILMHPMGVRVWAGRYSMVKHRSNAMHTLVTPPGDKLTVYDYGHTLARRVAPIQTVDMTPAWLWVRHQDTISGWKKADRPITPDLDRLFPIDWSLVA